MPLFYMSSRGPEMSLSIQPIKYSVMQDSNMGKPKTTSYKLHILHNFLGWLANENGVNFVLFLAKIP